MKTKVSTMVMPRSVLVIVCAVFGLTNCAPTELSSLGNNNASMEIGAYPRATIAPTVVESSPFDDAKLWPPQKPSRSKHITKSSLYKKPTKDKGGWAKLQTGAGEKSFYSSTLVSTGYDVEKDNLSRHMEAPSTPIDTVVDNVNGPKDYTNKNSSNSSISHSDITESISTNVDDDDDNKAGKDIDSISIAGTTKAEETYATASTTEGYHAKAGVAAASTTATIQTGLVENPNLNAEPIAKMTTKSSLANDVRDTKSISSPTPPAYNKSLPVNASVSSSLSSSFPQHSVTTVVPKLDVGHDGVKITKKKQLFDKHFIAAASPSSAPSGSLHAPITRDNPWPLSKNKPTKSGKKLMEVPNGYLGPIMMKEKTFSVSHHGKKPKPSIVEQLRDKKLVEIIAPTALMEPTIKVKSSVPPPPEFVAIDSASSSVSSTTTTTTEGPSDSSPAPTAATTKEEEIESETATTYFLVVTQDTKSPSKEISSEMEPMNAGEIETTLREIYTEVINAMEGASKKKASDAKIVLNQVQPSDIGHQRSSGRDHLIYSAAIGDVMRSSGTDPERFLHLDHLGSSNNDHSLYSNLQRSTVTDHVLSGENYPTPLSVTDSFSPFVSSSERTLIADHVGSPSPNMHEDAVLSALFPVISTQLPFGSTITDNMDGTSQTSLSVTDQNHSSTLSPVTHHASLPETSPTSVSISTSLSTILYVASDKTPITADVLTIDDQRTTFSSINHYPVTDDNKTPFAEGSSATVHRDSLDITSATSSPVTGYNMSPITDTPSETSTASFPATDHSMVSTTDYLIETNPTSKPIISTSPTITDHSFSPPIHHDSSAGTSSTPIAITSITTAMPDSSPTFATITTDPYTISSTTKQHPLKPTHDSEQTESKISDIQIEVYDSTVGPILASTNFKDNVYLPSSHVTTNQNPSNNTPQERFTQYVVDKATDFATQDSNSVAKASGKPEPAAIEIHINVSEGFGNESEDLEFSYRQSDYRKVTSKKPANTNFITLKPFDAVPQNETSNEAAEEIVVEIIDGNSNSTENSASRENLNVNPIFTFRSDDDSQVELKNVKYYPEDRPKEGAKSTDDFFVPQVGQQPPGANKPMMDRDSDTIFYISNTEVKVGESLPTTNTYDAQMKKSRLESQFFPANYEDRTKVIPQRYEEDIILSPVKNRPSDPLKVVRGPLDISYVGESVMEVEQVTATTTISPPIAGSTPDVIIQPAVLPEMAIGVPVIGELPPQIELKEIDFMPNFDGNKEESSIQYGGDLIDEGGAMGAGFDMDSYPLGNMGLGQKNDAISSQMVLNHRVNHLKKDELSADLAGSSETADGNDLLRRSNDSVNGTIIAERMGNATAYSVMEELPAGDGELHFTDLHTLFTACFATLLPLVLSVVMAFGLRHLYRKYQTNPFNVMGRNSSTDPLDAEKGNGGDGDVDGVETPEELRASSLAFGATTDSPSLNLCTNCKELNGKASNGDGRDCNGSVANGRVAPSNMDVDCIQAIIPDDVQEDNATLIVNCNIEAQPIAPPPTIPPQSTNTTSNAAATPTAGTMQCNYSGANGSITTMTLKNNHLIVETEERNDISRDARETKMHYNNSEKDGVFVVEVSRGADSKIMPGSPVADPADKRPFIDTAVNIVQSEEDKLLASHEEVQVHPPPPENAGIHDGIESNHLHQIDEVDEFEEGPKMTKHSNTGLSQSDLSSSSSVDSNKRYSYGNQELYTIEQQDYTTPSPAATKAPHPHNEPQIPQPENHNDDNGHSENSQCLENGPPTAPNCDSIYPADTDSDVNGHCGAESKPKITAALLKQDTVIVNEMTNGLNHNRNEDDDATPNNSIENLSNGLAPTTKTCNPVIDYAGDTENGFDSIISLPDPPSTEEMKQMNNIILMETNQLDSLPPPPPPGAENHHHHNGNGIAPSETENGDSHSIVSSASPVNTPTKVVMSSALPTITVAAVSAPTDIPHTNGNCMTGHTTTSNAAVVEVSGSS